MATLRFVSYNSVPDPFAHCYTKSVTRKLIRGHFKDYHTVAEGSSLFEHSCEVAFAAQRDEIIITLFTIQLTYVSL